MTFDEARKRAIERFDKAIAAIRAVVVDPLWTNPEFKTYKEALEELSWAVRAIIALNEVEIHAKREERRSQRSGPTSRIDWRIEDESCRF